MNIYSNKYVELILPLFIDRTFTYAVPDELKSQVEIGKRVIVQFGQKKFYTAIIYKVLDEISKDISPKSIDLILDEGPIVNDIHLKFWKWVSDYYFCSLGDVMKIALPSALRIESETCLELSEAFDCQELEHLSKNENTIYSVLKEKESLNITEIQKILGLKKVQPLVKNLISKGIVRCVEEIHDKYKPKTELWLKLNDELELDSDKLDQLANYLSKRAPKQSDVLMLFIHETSILNKTNEILKSKIAKRCSNTALQALIKKEHLIEFEKSVSRFESTDKVLIREFELTENQNEAFVSIKNLFETKDVVLLHGITSSGKTEIYIKLIEEQLAQNKQVLYLLPEIALTTQIIERLRRVFNDKVGVFHHRFNFNEKIELWKSVSSENSEDKKFQIIIGTRSALFLPFTNLGLIIVDEEHDSSYKQNDIAPRYNGRDTAIILARFHNAKVLLGSATPSIETYYNTKISKFGLVNLNNRFGDLPLPSVELVNMNTETRSRKGAYYLSFPLKTAIQNSLDKKEQVILFQNRRGYVPIVECVHCAWVPQCINCDISLTYHKSINSLKCHLCGFLDSIPDTCPVCASNHITYKSFGTERVEEEVQLIFPTSKVSRLDTDTTKGKHSHQNIINSFENGEIDILVGTQMITKGLDFNNVGLVGILNADSLLSFPDFRSFERAFQIITQIMGRAGRKNDQGKVILQTRQPFHEIIKLAIDSNYNKLYLSQIEERYNFKYPPFYRLVLLSVMHKNIKLVVSAASELKKILSKIDGIIILGPEEPYYGKVKLYYIRNILIKINRTSNSNELRDKIRNQVNKYVLTSSIRSLRISLDADPM